jgi:hypothetical protein
MLRRVVTFGCAAAVGFAGLLFTGSAQAGPVKLVGQTLNLHVAAAPGGSHIASTTFTDPGPFSDSVTATDIGDGFSRTATSSMNASSGVDHYHVDGKLTFNSTDTRAGRSSQEINSGFGVTAVFEVDEPYYLIIDRSLVVDFLKTNGAVFSENSYRFLTESGEDPYAGSAQFQLAPGKYTLDLKATGGADIAQFDDVSLDYSYRFDLNFTPGSEPPPSAIPLPPAVWSALVVLGLGAANRIRKHCMA